MTKKGKQGFASMHPKKQRAISVKGGRAAQEKGTGHRWTSTSARCARKRVKPKE